MLREFQRIIRVVVVIQIGIVNLKSRGGARCINGRLRGVETPADKIARVQAKVGIVEPDVNPAAYRSCIKTSVTDRYACARSILGAFGKNLYDAAYRIRPIEAAQRAGYDFDAFDLIERNILKRGGAGCRRIHPQPIDQDQCLIAVGTTDEYAAGLSESAGARDFQARTRLQHFNQCLLPALRNLISGDHGHRLQRL